MVNTRSSLSPSGSSKLLLDKLKMKKTISEDDNEDLSGGSEGSGDVSVKEVKRKQYNRGNKKVTDDRPLKKLKQVVEYDEDFYDSDDLEVENNESMKVCFYLVFFSFLIHTLRNQAKYIQMLAVVVGDIGSIEWELYFKHEDRVGGRIIFFPNHENNVIAIINSKLTPSQAKLFRETCFGHFLDMNPIAMQTQLIHSVLHREVHQKNPYEMWFKFGSQNFRFSLAEFAVVTGLLCVGDSDMSGYAKKENAFVDKYFSDQQVTVSAVEERFRYSDFKLDEYAVKMVVLYFVSNCLFTSPNSKKVPNEILNIVGIDEERSMLNLSGLEFIEKEDSDVDVDRDLVMKEVDDVDLVTENVKDYSIDPVLNLAESGGVLVNEGDTVVEGEGLQNVGDGGLVKEGHTALLVAFGVKFEMCNIIGTHFQIIEQHLCNLCCVEDRFMLLRNSFDCCFSIEILKIVAEAFFFVNVTQNRSRRQIRNRCIPRFFWSLMVGEAYVSRTFGSIGGDL
ncbi:hypothetical protein G4B88_009127 [Cannabis sativa]|uniref:DUF1985 domain-containing protein n=1 Tax=Cannabis sativa TaxID=3483 RepID=A0A7J6HQY1_CANSA|nr:hypothetical protein G4B88_009127 [Cannabis sativa]